MRAPQRARQPPHLYPYKSQPTFVLLILIHAHAFAGEDAAHSQQLSLRGSRSELRIEIYTYTPPHVLDVAFRAKIELAFLRPFARHPPQLLQ